MVFLVAFKILDICYGIVYSSDDEYVSPAVDSSGARLCLPFANNSSSSAAQHNDIIGGEGGSAERAARGRAHARV